MNWMVFLIGTLVGFILGGIFFYNYGKKMALDLHEIYVNGDSHMTCNQALKYEREIRNGR